MRVRLESCAENMYSFLEHVPFAEFSIFFSSISKNGPPCKRFISFVYVYHGLVAAFNAFNLGSTFEAQRGNVRLLAFCRIQKFIFAGKKPITYLATYK